MHVVNDVATHNFDSFDVEDILKGKKSIDNKVIDKNI